VNDWLYEQRHRKRHQACLLVTRDLYRPGVWHGYLCGCGCMTPPSKAKKTRIIKRTLKRQLERELRNME